MRTFVSILVGLALSFALGALDLLAFHGQRLALLSRPIALLLAALTATRLEQEWSMVLTLAAMPITLTVIGILFGLGIHVGVSARAHAQVRASDRPA